MKKIIVTITFLIICSLGFSQERVNVPGTNVWIIQPEGILVSQAFDGVRVNKKANIQVIDMGGGNFYKETKDFKKSYLEIPEVKVFEYQELKVGKYPAKLILIQNNPKRKAYQLVFGDSTFSATVLGSYKANDEAMGKKIKKAMYTVRYKKDEKVNPYKQYPFSFDDSKSRLKFSSSTDGYLTYELPGESGSEDGPKLLVTPMPENMSQIPEEMLKTFSTLEKSDNPDINIISSTRKEINGYDSQEVVTKVKNDKGKNSFSFMQTIRYEKHQVLIMGKVSVEGKFDAKIFTELTDTIRFK